MTKFTLPLCVTTVLAMPLYVLDVILYLLSLAWFFKLLQNNGRSDSTNQNNMQSVAVGKETKTHGVPRRSYKSPDTLKTSNDTIYDMTSASVQEFADQPAMVSRIFLELKKLKETDKFPSKVFEETKLERITYRQLGENILHFGAGLRALGMEPLPPTTKSSSSFDDQTGSFSMVLFEDTCWQWTTAIQGAFSQSLVVATCYATLGHEAVVSAVTETNATTLFCNFKHAATFADMAHRMPSLKTIVASTHEMPANKDVTNFIPKTSTKNIKIVTSDEVMEMGKKELKSYKPTPPRPEDVAVIMYTSGSTGKPKGVVMKHSQLVSGVIGMAENVDLRRGKEVFVSYLPLAHILALQVENILLSVGAKICYSDPRMLAKNLPMFQPTLFAGVPKVWDLLKGGLERKLAAAPLVKLVFDALMNWKMFMISYGLDTPITNLFFQVISKKVFGGALRFGVTGGGPIHAGLHQFCRALFGCPIIQGYALTETCVGGCFQALDDPRCSIVGPPVPSVEIMLQSEPDIKDSGGFPYLHTDTKGSKGERVIGRGEVCFRGPSISSGYYKMVDKTREEYDSEGWFHSGDVGQYLADGVLQIVDRKKNLVKLRGGEYVAVESMESAFCQSPFVTAVCVVANGDLDAPLALVNADNDYLKSWAAENGMSSTSLEKVAEEEKACQAVLNSMIGVGKEAGLTSLELRLKDCVLIVGDDWGPGSGMTASMKIDRKKIMEMHDEQVTAMLKRNGVEQ